MIAYSNSSFYYNAINANNVNIDAASVSLSGGTISGNTIIDSSGPVSFNSINSNNVNINASGVVSIPDGTISGNATIVSNAPAVSGPAEIYLGSANTDLAIGGDLSATATYGNIYYYGGAVGGNATFNAAEAFDNRMSIALGRYRNLTIGGNLNATTAGNMTYGYGTVNGNTTINAGKLAGFYHVNLHGNLIANAAAFGFASGTIDGLININAPGGSFLGADGLVTAGNNVTISSALGNSVYYLGNITGNLNITAKNIVDVGNSDLFPSLSFTYGGHTYTIADSPVPITPDLNDLAIGGNANFVTDGLVNYSGITTGTLSMDGSGVTIKEKDTALLNLVQADNLVDITSETGSILDARPTEEPNIIAKDVVLYAPNGTIGTADDDLNIDLLASTLSAEASGDINITEPNSKMELNNVISNNGSVKLTAYGDILDNTPDELPNVTGNNITLISLNGNIGTLTDAIDFELLSGVLDTSAQGITNVRQTSGTLRLDQICNPDGDVYITFLGNIIDNTIDELPNIIARNITIISENGSIGTLTNDINIDLNGGVFNAKAKNYINITEYSGDLALDRVESTTGNVKLTSDGSILDNRADETANVIGNDITLISNNGNIGSSNNHLDVTAKNNLIATTTKDLNLTGTVTGNITTTAVNSNLSSTETLNITNANIAGNFSAHSSKDLFVTGNVGGTIVATTDYPQGMNNKTYLTLTGDANLLYVNGYDVQITADGSILDGNIYEYQGVLNESSKTPEYLENSTQIWGNKINLISNNGNIGVADDDLKISSYDSLNASAVKGEINITQFKNPLGGVFDLIFENIKADHDIKITSYDGINSDLVYINPGNIYINSGKLELASFCCDVGALSKININYLNTTSNPYIQLKVLSAGNIYLNSTTNIALNQVIADNDFNLQANSIIDGSSNELPNIVAKNINLTATNGSIGTLTDDLNIDSYASSLFAKATGDINLTETPGLEFVPRMLNITKTLVGGIVTSVDILIRQNGPSDQLISGYSVNPQGIIEATYYNGDKITLNNNKELIFYPVEGGSIGNNEINQPGGVVISANQFETKNAALTGNTSMGINKVESTGGNVKLTSYGDIVDKSIEETPSVTGKDITLISNNGNIGSSNDHLDVIAYNNLTATATKDLNLTGKIGGNITATAVNSNLNSTENLKLTNTNLSGNLIATTTKEFNMAGKVGGNITATAVNSNLNSTENLKLTNTNLSGNLIATTTKDFNMTGKVGGNITATADNVVIVANNNININSITANNFVCTYSETGSILDDRMTEDPNIIGMYVILSAPNGTIGTAADDLNIDLLASGLNAEAKGDINITEPNSNIDVNRIQSTNGNVKLTAYGDILDDRPDETANVIGKDITLISTNGNIGSATEDLDITATGNLIATSSGLINLNQTSGTLNINKMYSNGNNIQLTAYDINLLQNGILSSRKLNNVNTADHLTALSTGDSGNITLNAGNNLILNQGSNILSFATNSFKTGHISLTAAKDLYASGIVKTDGSINVNSGNINLTAGGNINLDSCSLLSAKGIGTNSNGGNIILSANTANGLIKFSNPAYNAVIFDVSSETKAGLIKSTAGYIQIHNAILKSGSINGQRGNVEFNANFTTGFKLLSGGGNVTFNGNTDAGFFNLMYLIDNPNARGVLSTRNIANLDTGDHKTAPSVGNSGDIIFNANRFALKDGAGPFRLDMLAFADNGFTGGNISINSPSIDLGNETFIKTDQDINFNLTTPTIPDAYISFNNSMTVNNQVIIGKNINLNANNALEIVLDGTLQTYFDINVEKKLLVNVDNTIDPSSNIVANIINGNINVNNVISSSGKINIINAPLIRGNATLKVQQDHQNIIITNNSANNLILGSLNPNSSGEININGSKITSNYPTQNGYLTVVYQDTGITNPQVNITNNSTSNILLGGNITNTGNPVNITNTGGNLLNNSGTPLITGSNLQLSTPNGNIGAELSPINVNASGNIVTTAKNAYIKSSETLKLINTNIINNLIATTTKDFNMTGKVGGNIITTAKNTSLTSTENINLNNANISGNLTANTTKDFNLTGKVVGNITATAANTNLNSTENLKLTNSTITNNLIAYTPKDFIMNGQVGGSITATAYNVNITSPNNIKLNKITAGDSTTITSINGSIFDANNSVSNATNYNIKSPNKVTLTALNGNIGGNDEIGNSHALNLFGDMTIKAEAGTSTNIVNNINLEHLGVGSDSNRLNIDTIKANNQSTVNIKCADLDPTNKFNTYKSYGMLDDTTGIDNDIDIEAKNINLQNIATFGPENSAILIGFTSRELEVKLLNNGILNAKTGQYILIKSDGDMRIGKIETTNASNANNYIQLEAINGSIIATRTDQNDYDIITPLSIGGSVALKATNNIGASDKTLKIKMNNDTFQSESTLGDSFIKLTGNPYTTSNILIVNSKAGGNYNLESNVKLKFKTIYDDNDTATVYVDPIALNAGGNVNIVTTSIFADIAGSDTINPANKSILATGNININSAGKIGYGYVRGYLGSALRMLPLILESGGNVSLTAGDYIGSTTSSNLINAQGNISANARNDINLAESSGVMKVNKIQSLLGNVSLSNESSIIDNSADELANITGKNININSGGAAIGTFDNDLNIDLKGGALTANAYGFINIKENAGDLSINQVINNGNAGVNLVSAGSILNSRNDTNPNIISQKLYLLAGGNGSIGTNVKYLNVDTRNNGTLDAVAKGGVYIEELSGNMNLLIGSTAGWNDVNLRADSNILDASAWELPNIYAKSINLTAWKGSIGSADNDLNINLDFNLFGGILNANAADSINITQDLNIANLVINKVQAANDVKLTSASGVIDASLDEFANITGKNIILNAVVGSSVGTFVDGVDVQVNGGTMTALGYGYINLKSVNDIPVNVISNAGRADTEIYSINGSILNGNPAQPVNIYTRGLTMNTSPNGSIGTALTSLNVDTNFNSSGGKLIALAKDYVNINEVNGDLNIDAVSNAGRSDVTINAEGSILNAATSGINYNIYARSIMLNSTNGSIGTAVNPLEVYSNYETTGGSLNATANNGLINILQPVGDLYLNQILSGNNITLNSGGRILTNTVLPIINVSGFNVNMASPIAIGNVANPIEFKYIGTFSAVSPDTHVHYNPF